jgi:hypothetical protein
MNLEYEPASESLHMSNITASWPLGNPKPLKKNSPLKYQAPKRTSYQQTLTSNTLIIYHQPSNPNHQPSTIHPQPQTRNQIPENLNHNPSTSDSNPQNQACPRPPAPPPPTRAKATSQRAGRAESFSGERVGWKGCEGWRRRRGLS